MESQFLNQDCPKTPTLEGILLLNHPEVPRLQFTDEKSLGPG